MFSYIRRRLFGSDSEDYEEEIKESFDLIDRDTEFIIADPTKDRCVYEAYIKESWEDIKDNEKKLPEYKKKFMEYEKKNN